MHPFLKNLQRQAEENPMLAVGVGATVVAAVTQFARTIVSAGNSRVWAKEVSRRAVKDGLKK